MRKGGENERKSLGGLIILVGFVLGLMVSDVLCQEPYKIGVSLGIT